MSRPDPLQQQEATADDCPFARLLCSGRLGLLHPACHKQLESRTRHHMHLIKRSLAHRHVLAIPTLLLSWTRMQPRLKPSRLNSRIVVVSKWNWTETSYTADRTSIKDGAWLLKV